MDYAECRSKLYGSMLDEKVFTWDWMYGKEYALATTHAISKEHRAELARATEQLGRIFTKASAIVQEADPTLLLEMGIHQNAINAVRACCLPGMPTLIGRFDFLHTSQGWKILEFNSDTPGGIVEAYYVNAKVCDFFGVMNPNEGLIEDLTAAFQDTVNRYQKLGYNTERIFFSALDWHEEDAGTARFLQQCSGLEAQFVALKDLRICQDALYALIDGEMLPVDILYRLHPLGIMAEEQDVDGYPTGAHLLDLVARGKLAIINPPNALISQTKAMLALIWNLHENGAFFSDEEHKTIAEYMLPTYFENRFTHKTPYVSKPVLGREGGAVTLFRADGEVMAKDQEACYWEQDVIYQQYVELEPIEVETLEGLYQGFLIWGSFLIGGKASAITARVGGRITSDLAYCLPVRLEND